MHLARLCWIGRKRETVISMPLVRSFYQRPQGLRLIGPIGDLLRIDERVPMSLENLIAAHKVLPEKDILSAAKFIRDCLRLDPDQRPSVVDLQVHDWMMNAWNC
jgi:serine/threonine protein kinase